MSRLALSFRALTAPKDGNTDDEYEDAYAGGVSQDGRAVNIALADGASSAVFARTWARLLVDEFSLAPFVEETTGARIARLGARWRSEVGAKPLAWYAEEKLPQGSSAALLVVTWDLDARTWSARAVGDCCVFVVREALTCAFPLARANDFNSHPPLLSTERPARAFVALPDQLFDERDRFLLVSDALAAYFLTEHEAGRAPWNTVPAEKAAFAAWLAGRREAGALKNDDVTLITVTATAP